VRPKTIVYFERIIFGTLLLSALHAYLYLGWDRVIGQFATDPDLATLDRNLMVDILLATWIFLLALFITLILLVSRRRSKIAMWILIVWVLFRLLYSSVQTIMNGVLLGSGLLSFLLSIVVLQGIGQGVAVGLLFTPSARRWMRREDEKLRRVFH
jgi:hypothetical protein